MVVATVSESDPIALRAALAEVAASLRGAVVRIGSRAGTGSGTAWAAPGGEAVVVTNAHVVRGEQMQVQTADGQSGVAKLLRRDAERDLAVLEAAGIDLTPVATRQASTLRVGELVLALGHPWGGGAAVTAGIVASTAGLAVEGGRIAAVHADVRLAPGNSGGPLVDASGAVVGINTMVAGGLGLAIPTEAVESFLAATQADEVQPGVIGLVAVPVPLPAAGGEGGTAEEVGLLVTDVLPGSAAEGAGLIPGDILLRIDGVGGGLEALSRRLRGLAAGRTVTLEVLRGGQRRTLVVVAAAAAA